MNELFEPSHAMDDMRVLMNTLTTGDLTATIEALEPTQAVRLSGVIARLAARLPGMRRTTKPPADAAEDRLVDIHECAKIIGFSSHWIYKHSRELPFTVVTRGRLRFSAQGIQRWVNEQKSVQTPPAASR